MSEEKWRRELLDKIFDILAGMNLRKLAKAYKALKYIDETTNERTI